MTNKVKYFQLRIKKKSSESLLKISRKIKKITNKNNVKFIINDNPTLAKKVNVDGCHIGQKDMSFKKSRKILGKNKIIGITCHNSRKLALKAKKYGASYIAFGSFFKTTTKKTTLKAKLDILRWAKKKLVCPSLLLEELIIQIIKRFYLMGQILLLALVIFGIIKNLTL